MGDILWAHLEILQKDVDRGANIENVPSNYTDPSFAIPDTFQRTYTQRCMNNGEKIDFLV